MTNTTKTDATDVQPQDAAYAEHQRWGGTYLIVADTSEEFPIALEYATRMANKNKCRVGVFHVMEKQDFIHWGNIEKRMRDELREQAEQVLNEACLSVEDKGGVTPALYLAEGSRTEALASVIENDPNISMLILCGATQGKNPGPLVSHFTGKGLSRLRVPVMIVPDHLGL